MNKEKYLSCMLFKNTKGLLGKVATTFGNNDINIENMSISPINTDETIQKVTVYTSGIRSERVINEAVKSIPEVLDVFTSNNFDNLAQKELCLIKIDNRNNEMIRLANVIKAGNGKLIFLNGLLSIYEVVDDVSKINTSVDELNKISSNIEISRDLILNTNNYRQLII